MIHPPRTMTNQVAHPLAVWLLRWIEPSLKIWKKMAREVTIE